MSVETANGLTARYWSDVQSRVSASLRDMRARVAATTSGRSVPDDSLRIGAGRRLHLAVLYVDICRFSEHPCDTYYDQQIILNALNILMTELIRIAEDYGATVEKNTGDGVMAYFAAEDSGSEESACASAIACALTMFAAAETIITPILSNSSLPPFRFRIAIDFGPVTVANVGAPRRFKNIVAIGTTANIAAKLLAHAGPGQLLIGERVVCRLPMQWRAFCQVHGASTGYVYIANGAPYRCYTYAGRWSRLL